MKKLINLPGDVVRECLEGMARAHPDLIRVSYDPTFIYRADAPVENAAAVVSGGGSGHEPLHGGFVGMGMLHAACPGEVFTSPTPDQMLEAAKRVHGGGGVLFIVKNYSGDLMNFEMAAELAHGEGIRIATTLIDDDVAVRDSLYTQGRRGVGTTVLAEKICGAASERGYDLNRVAGLCRKVNTRGRSMGMALRACTVPMRGEPTFSLPENEIEIGIGIHGEPGRERMEYVPADRVTELLAVSILEAPAYARSVREFNGERGSFEDVLIEDSGFAPGDRLLAMVNGMGGTPLSELYIVYRKLDEICRKKQHTIIRTLVGSFITSLEMQGCSITLLKMDEELLSLWDSPVNTASLRWGV
jgi:dihydroxyacetone kinase-like protein